MTILNLYSEVPVVFPVDITVKGTGNTFYHRFNEGDQVECWWCKAKITLNQQTVFRYLHPIDGNARVRCKICSNVTDIVYYANSDNRIKLKTWDSEHVKTEFTEA